MKSSRSFMLFCHSKRDYTHGVSVPYREARFGLGVNNPVRDLKFTIFPR